MAETITVNAVTTLSIPRDEVEWSESAFLGEVGQGRFTVHDTAGTVDIPGHKAISVEQSSSTPARIFTGYVGRKRIGRGQSQNVSAAREISIETRDLNDLLGRYIITDTDGKRSAETVSTRLTWLLASDYLSTLVADRGAVASVTGVGMDAADYRGQRPGDVLAACAKAARMNYYVRYHASGPELVFRDDNVSTSDTCTLSISNVSGDINLTTVFPPSQDADLTQDPEHVYSGVSAAYAKGSIYATRAATATAFAARDGVTSDSATKTAATARRDADTFLWEAHTEEQLLPVTLRLPASKVGLIQAGQRISTRMTHLAVEGWDPARYARILRKRITQPDNTDDVYDVAMDLSPQEAGPSAASIVQSAFGVGAAGGLTLSLPNPVTVGNILVVAMSARGDSSPASPSTAISRPRWGAGAWTQRPNSTAANTSYNDGVAIWTKTADDTSQTGYIAAASCRVAIYEVTGATFTGAVTDYQHQGAAALLMDMGSLGTVATGSVAFMVVLWADQKNASDTMFPTVEPATGWTKDYFGPAYLGGAIHWNSPLTVHASALGTGAALTAAVTRSALLHLNGTWAGAALVLPPV